MTFESDDAAFLLLLFVSEQASLRRLASTLLVMRSAIAV